jgi:predicted ATP-grasp superfamily ATP-dependent carboligase
LPTSDYAAKYLSEFKSILLDQVHFIIPDLNIFMMGYDKNKLMAVCEANNIPHPSTLDLSKLDHGQEIAQFNFPAIIKPNRMAGAIGITPVKSFKEVWQNYDALQNKFSDCHLQEFIPHNGKQYKVAILIKDTKVIFSTVLEKCRFYPISGGSSCFNRSIINDDLVVMCTRILNLIQWVGFADFDLIEDTRDGQIKIIEINPRFPACLKASDISGIDFSNALVNLSMNKPVVNGVYKPDKFLRYFSMDLLYLLSSKNKLKGLKQWSRHFFSPNHHLQDFEISDPIPFFVGTYNGFSKLITSKIRSVINVRLQKLKSYRSTR